MQIGIVGLGLIGGSLGLDLRSQGHQVWGMSRNQTTCEQAVTIGAVDFASLDLDGLGCNYFNTDLVIVCTPIASILPTIKAIAPHLASTTIISDVGSVKSAIAVPAEKLCDRFVGGHPMAGTAFSGIAAAERNLFRDSPFVLTPTKNSDREACEIMRSLWVSLGAVIYECSPEVHDRAVAWISHLPILISAGLILACDRESDQAIGQLAQNLASSGFRDTSRVGGGNPELGRLIAENNQTALLASLKEYQQVLQNLISQVESGDWQSLESSLQQAHQIRQLYSN
jgi:arogenate dehydrogenase (NADP+)